MEFQLELPFYAEEKETEKKAELPFFQMPKNDNEKLLNFQWEYYKGDKNALGRIYNLGFKIAFKMINLTAKKNKHIKKLATEERQEKAHNAIVYIVERYLKNENFLIKTSMTSYIFLRVKHELFYKRKCDDLVQFVDWDVFRESEK